MSPKLKVQCSSYPWQPKQASPHPLIHHTPNSSSPTNLFFSLIITIYLNLPTHLSSAHILQPPLSPSFIPIPILFPHPKPTQKEPAPTRAQLTLQLLHHAHVLLPQHPNFLPALMHLPNNFRQPSLELPFNELDHSSEITGFGAAGRFID